MKSEFGLEENEGMDECLIPKSAVFEGNLNAEGKVIINGRFVGGKVTVNGQVYVGTEALVTGEIEANEVIVGGRFEGNVIALDRLEIESAGKLFGEIQAKRLLINDGAEFEGTCRMTGGEAKPAAQKTSAQPVTKQPPASEPVAESKRITVTIDGPAGAGKTTIARRLASELNYTYLDTGAMYRALTWKALKNKLDLKDENALVEMAAGTELKIISQKDYTQVLVDGRDVSEEIRKPYVSRGTSAIADVKGVREIMVWLQRKSANGRGVVLEGRDTGTVVFPDAEKKFYLDASLEERALRRANELEKKGVNLDLDQVMDDIRKRDERDRSRPYGALKKAEGAIIIDTTKMNIDDVTKVALRHIGLNN